MCSNYLKIIGSGSIASACVSGRESALEYVSCLTLGCFLQIKLLGLRLRMSEEISRS